MAPALPRLSARRGALGPLLAGLALVLAAGAGCVDNGTGMKGGGGEDGPGYTCQVSIGEATFGYVVTGNQMAATFADGSSQTYPRVGAGTGILGTWTLGKTYDPVTRLDVTLTMTIEASRATATSACVSPTSQGMVSVSSEATVTDTEVMLLESDAKQIRF